MCTVTYIPSGDSIFLTSNRDEKVVRGNAVLPQRYGFESGDIVFPKDHKGGSWIAAHENGNAVVLLNGAFLAHIPDSGYRKSRGLIVLDLADSPTPYNSFLAINLSGIEPFTLVIVDDDRLFECRWDGRRKYEKHLNRAIPHIWSSCTLYNSMVMEKRESWFSEWLSGNPDPSLNDILNFHQFTGEGDSYNDLRMSREGILCTVSITALALSAGNTSIRYLDLVNDQQTEMNLPHVSTIMGR